MWELPRLSLSAAAQSALGATTGVSRLLRDELTRLVIAMGRENQGRLGYLVMATDGAMSVWDAGHCTDIYASLTAALAHFSASNSFVFATQKSKPMNLNWEWGMASETVGFAAFVFNEQGDCCGYHSNSTRRGVSLAIGDWLMKNSPRSPRSSRDLGV